MPVLWDGPAPAPSKVLDPQRVLEQISPSTVLRGYFAGLGLPMIGVQISTSEVSMLYWALMFLVVALIAGVLGFTGVAVAAAGIAKVLFVIFLVLFLVSIVAHLGGGRRSLN